MILKGNSVGQIKLNLSKSCVHYASHLSTARQAHGDVAAQHCAVQLPQCSMVALSILEGMGVGGGRALRGALASGGLATKIFLYNKLPT
jgi:hypothetical protein